MKIHLPILCVFLISFCAQPTTAEIDSGLGLSLGDGNLGTALTSDEFGIDSKTINEIIDITKLGIRLVNLVRQLISQNFNGTDQFSWQDGDKKLLSMYNVVTHTLNNIQVQVQDIQQSIKDLTRSLPQMVRWEVALNTLSDYVSPIQTLYHKFLFYQQHRDEVEKMTLMDFAKSVVSHDAKSVASMMGQVNIMVAPDLPPAVEKFEKLTQTRYEMISNEVDSKISVKLRQAARLSSKLDKKTAHKLTSLAFRPGLFEMLEDNIEATDFSICSMQQSPQSLIFGFYALIALVQASGYTMAAFSWNILRFYNEGNFTVEEHLMDQLYEHYNNALKTKAIEALSRASNRYRKCEPNQHKEGLTYEAVTELLQGYVENEVDMNHRGTCTNSCDAYEANFVQSCYMPETQFCNKQRQCKGTVHNCTFLDSDSQICMSSTYGRRYDWIRYESMQVLGRENNCPGRLMDVHSWWRWFVHCSYCICYCDDPNSPSSDRYISLLPSVSATDSNKVVTGIRFTKRHRIIHAQVQQGKLLPHGLVDKNTLSWVDLEPISVDSREHELKRSYVLLKYEVRSFDLDLLEVPSGHVVTGVKFRTLGNHVNLEVMTTPFDFATGNLSSKMSYWISNDATPISRGDERMHIPLGETDVPTKAPGSFSIDSQNNTYIQMGPTSLHLDVAQSTVPFFDAQPVVTSPPSPLTGIHLHHKGAPGYGGFFAFETLAYNVTEQFLAH